MSRKFSLPRGAPRVRPQGDARAERLALLSVCAAIFMMLLDGTIVNVAQAEIRQGLGASLSELQWVVDAYLLAFAVPLLAFGRLGDVYGRRRLFILGTAIFTVASALCGAASLLGELSGPTGSQALIGARVLQGIGGAMVLPQTLALIAAVFPPERRGAAFGTSSAFASLAAVAGPPAGGLIVTFWTWEGIFLLNLPIGAAVILAARRFVPESRDPDARRQTDWLGMALSGAGLFGVVYGLIEAARLGWGHPAIWFSLAAGLVLLAAFVAWERRAPAAMLRLELFQIRNFSVGCLAMVCFNVGFHGVSLPLNVFLQGLLGYSPLKAGLILTPSAVAMAAVAPVGGRLSDRFGSRGLLTAGFAISALGLLLLAALVKPGVSPAALVVALVVLGAGTGLIVSQANVAPLLEVPVAVMGSASGLLNAVRVAAIVLGVAFLASLLQGLAGVRAEDELAGTTLPPEIRAEATRLVREGRFDHLDALGTATDSVTLTLVGDDLMDGFAQAFSLTLLFGAAVIAAGIGAALLLRTRPTTAPHPAPAPRMEPASAGD